MNILKYRRFNLRIGFSVFIAIVFIAAAVATKDYDLGGSVFPLVVSIPAILTSLLALYAELRATGEEDESGSGIDIAVDRTIPKAFAYRRTTRLLVWFAGLYLAMWFAGFKLAIMLFVLLYTKVEGKGKWRVVLSLTALVSYMLFFHFERVLSVAFPDAWLDRYFYIPWLF